MKEHYSLYEWECDAPDELRSAYELTLEELSGSDIDVYLERKHNHLTTMHIEIDDEIFSPMQLGGCSAESLADFCRRYLKCYDKLENQQ